MSENEDSKPVARKVTFSKETSNQETSNQEPSNLTSQLTS